jgi:hypothetical protein
MSKISSLSDLRKKKVNIEYRQLFLCVVNLSGCCLLFFVRMKKILNEMSFLLEDWTEEGKRRKRQLVRSLYIFCS